MRKSTFEFKSPFTLPSRRSTIRREKANLTENEDEQDELSKTPIRLKAPKSGRLFDKQGLIEMTVALTADE